MKRCILMMEVWFDVVWLDDEVWLDEGCGLMRGVILMCGWMRGVV